jgi:hypothetical protein
MCTQYITKNIYIYSTHMIAWLDSTGIQNHNAQLLTQTQWICYVHTVRNQLMCVCRFYSHKRCQKCSQMQDTLRHCAWTISTYLGTQSYIVHEHYLPIWAAIVCACCVEDNWCTHTCIWHKCSGYSSKLWYEIIFSHSLNAISDRELW